MPPPPQPRHPNDSCAPPYASRYGGERHDPSIRHCGALALHFDGRRLRLTGPGMTPIDYPAVSGRPLPATGGAAPTFDYSPARQRLSGTGPIPEGVYWINPSETWERPVYAIFQGPAWGDYRITIHPFLTTDTFCRGGFFIHGGSVPGSAGCIDLTSHMNTFIADLRRLVGSLNDCQIHLTVDYP